MSTMEPLASLGRASGNPLLTPADVTPSRPDFEVIGVFNPAVLVGDDGETALLVAERPRDIPPDEVAAPVDAGGGAARDAGNGPPPRPTPPRSQEADSQA